ncbi:MAG: STAS/SEC14 domain-containing protein [Saprospiraceae bacterium]
MIHQLNDVPNTMVGFKAIDDVTKEDFDKVVLPAVAELVHRTDKLNYLLIIDTALKNSKIGAWLKDAMLLLNNLNKWNRAAIVSESDGKENITELFSKVVPGEFRVYAQSELDEAIQWVSEQNEFTVKQVFQQEGDSKD